MYFWSCATSVGSYSSEIVLMKLLSRYTGSILSGIGRITKLVMEEFKLEAFTER